MERSEKWGYVRIYSHDVERWLQNNLQEIPEKFRNIFPHFVRYCRRTGVKEITLYTYLPKVGNFLKYLHDQDIEGICEIDEDSIYDFLRSLEEETARTAWTQYGYLVALKKFLSFLIEKEICPEKLRRVYEKVRLRRLEFLPPTLNSELVKLVDEFIQKILDLKYKVLYCILRETGRFRRW